jgi:hypothetical protein
LGKVDAHDQKMDSTQNWGIKGQVMEISTQKQE